MAVEFVKSVRLAARQLGIGDPFALPNQPEHPATRPERRAAQESGPASVGLAPDPARARTRDGFVECIRELVIWAGVRHCRDLADRAQRAGQRLSKSTAQRIITPERGEFPTRAALQSIVIACGLEGEDLNAWTAAWQRCQTPLSADEYLTYYWEPGLGYANPDGSYSSVPQPHLFSGPSRRNRTDRRRHAKNSA
jgi:hypothetical protein